MVPTINYGHFVHAEKFARPVRELLTGQPGPITAMEEYLWLRFNLARARIQQQQRG
jgi:hypothetical protein